MFLAGIWDLFDHSIVGWSMGERPTTDLGIAALVMGLGRRDPADELIRHADHGTQYRATEFSNRLTDWGLRASFGSVGDCYDNSAMEGVWSRLKTKIIDIHDRPIEAFTPSELRTALLDYIEVSYNRQPDQARLGHRTPPEVHAATTAAREITPTRVHQTVSLHDDPLADAEASTRIALALLNREEADGLDALLGRCRLRWGSLTEFEWLRTRYFVRSSISCEPYAASEPRGRSFPAALRAKYRSLSPVISSS